MKQQVLLMLCVAMLASDARATAPETLPEKGAANSVPAARWEEAFVTGNGRLGAMLFGDPENETLIANHCRLFLPLGSYEKVPDLAAHLPELRRVFREEAAQTAMTFLMAKAAEQGFPGIINTDPFHPGLFVHVRQPSGGDVRDYVRTEDFRTGEVAVHWRDDRGSFGRRLSVSRPHNVFVFSQICEQQGQIACDLVFDRIRVAGANRLLLLVRIVPGKTPLPAEASDAWAYSAKNPDFTDGAG